MGLLNKFRKRENKRDIEEEVIENLKELLNTKQSYGAWQRGLGLKNYANINSSIRTAEEIIHDIETNILLFEKRLKCIKISLLSNEKPLSLRLQLECLIGGKFHSFYIGFTNFPGPIRVEERENESI